MDSLAPLLATILTAATPLLLAGLGEHVVERAGVLNLGVEGMMIIGAAGGVAIAVLTDSGWLGLAGGALAGVTLSLVFAALVLGLASNQVATGLAITILGLGLAGLVGQSFVGTPRPAFGHLDHPALADIAWLATLAARLDAVVILALVGAVAAALWLAQTRGGLALRAVGENQTSAHALGLSVRQVRFLAILFGGLCAGLAGAYLSLVYTRFWAPGMTAGRGWIALALVVFAAGRVWRLALGALLFGGLTVAQLHAQAGNVGIPAQFLSALPYLMTIAALISLSLGGRRGQGAAGSLAEPFVPDR